MSEQPTVAVSARAEREVLPDSFVLDARVRCVAGDADAARAALVERYAQLQAVPLPDSVSLRHGGFGIWPTDTEQRRWEASRTLSATGTDLSTVGAVADALGGVADVSLDGPRWQVDRANAVYADLQADVVAEARARAERYAAALGATLGRLVELQDPDVGHGGGFAMRVAAAGGRDALSTLDLTPQLQTVGATVNARWYLVLPD